METAAKANQRVDRLPGQMSKRLPTKDGARVGGRLAILNACNLFESAEVAAERGNFGAAVGLAVLAMEEATKGRALLGYALAAHTGVSFGMSNTKFKDFLHCHGPRYAIAFMQGLTAAGHSLLLGLAPQTEEDRAQLQRDVDCGRWLTAANSKKQRGFYVDFSGNDVWSSPSNVTPDDWDRARRIVSPFLDESRRQDAIFGANPPG